MTYEAALSARESVARRRRGEDAILAPKATAAGGFRFAPGAAWAERTENPIGIDAILGALRDPGGRSQSHPAPMRRYTASRVSNSLSEH